MIVYTFEEVVEISETWANSKLYSYYIISRMIDIFCILSTNFHYIIKLHKQDMHFSIIDSLIIFTQLSDSHFTVN